MNDQEKFVQELVQPLYENKTWIRVLALMLIIPGIIIGISIVGLIFAWLPIWLGIILYKLSSSVEEAYMNGSKESAIESLRKLGVYFKIMGVITFMGILLQLGGTLFLLIQKR